jgi:hypothetical protein
MAKDKRSSVYFDRSTLEFVGIDQERLSQLKKSFPGLNIEQELGKMKVWLTFKGITRTGNMAFILNWLGKASSNSAPVNNQGTTSTALDTPLANLLRDYLKDLWKDREHILEFNTTRR